MNASVRWRWLGVAGLVLCLLAAGGATAADTPREAMLGYLEACNAGDFESASRFLESSGAPAERAKLARHFKFVLDQTLWIEPEALSEQPAGDLEDGMPARDLVGEIPSEKGDVAVWLERAGDGAWRISGATVKRIEGLYEQYGLGPLGEILPEFMFESYATLELWQWLALPLLVLLTYLISAPLTAGGTRLVLRLTGRTKTELDDEIVHAAASPITASLMLGVFVAGSAWLGLAIPAQELIRRGAQGLLVITITWLSIRLIDVAAHAFELRLADRGDTTAATIVPVGRRISKVFLLVIAVLAGLQNLGFNVVSIIAGLGVVGIAVALGAQKTFEHFFGTVEILVDQPVRRGDFCRFGDKLGVIEDIGLRSTRVRTLDRTIVTVPNSEFAALQIENFGARDRIRFYTVLGLRYETSADQLRHALVELKRLLVEHPKVSLDPARVRFVAFGAFSLDVEIFAYILTSDWNEFLAVREDLMLQMIDIVAASGTGFAFPSQTLYVAPDDGLDAERTRAAEDAVKDWKQKHELWLPDFPEERIRELEDSGSYPPKGSALAPARPGRGAEES